jgi:hypothetical protein
MTKNKGTENMKNTEIENDDEYETVEDNFPEPWIDMEPGEFITGKYIGSALINGSDGKPFPIYKMVREDDNLVSVSGASLEARMKTIPINAHIKVIYTGTEKTKHGTKMKTFEVKVAKGTRLIQP